MISLAGGLPLQWPVTLELMFDSFATLSSAGTTLMIPDCELTHLSTADAYFYKQIAYTFSVPIIIVACVVAWLMVYCCCHRRYKIRLEWTKVTDYTVLSIVLMLFLCYPMLVKLTLSMLKCPAIGGVTKMYLMADLQEPCFTGRHLTYIWLLTVPQLFCYVLGLPILAFVIIHRNKEKLHEKKFYTRYGLLYMGYREGREWWEIIIAFRKITVVLIGTFGTVMGVVDLQAFVALGTVFLSIIIHLIGQPFDRKKENSKRLHDLEFTALSICWLTFWGGLLFFLGQEKPGSVPVVVKILTTLILVSVNIVFVLYSSFCFGREYLRDRKKANGRRKTKALQIEQEALNDLTKVVPINDEPSENENNQDDENNNEINNNNNTNTSVVVVEKVPEDEDIPLANRKHRIASLAFLPEHHLGHFGEEHEEAQNIHDEFHIHEENFKKKSNARQAKSRRNTNLRMAARKKIKQNKAMSKVPMFAHLEEATIARIVNKCSFKRWKENDVICRQGDEADCLYIIAAGDCSVSVCDPNVFATKTDGDGDESDIKKNGRVVCKLRSNSFFGESALIGLKQHDEENENEEIVRERNATVIVLSSMMDTLSLSRQVFRSMLESELLDESIVDSVGRVGKERAESNRKSFAIPSSL